VATGNLKTWFLGRGFGFIQDDASSGPDIFMHASALLGINPDDLKTGDRLSYDIGPGRNGRTAAANVRRAE
jgi:CspA family cold shock protein